ncbi:cyclin N-terminal domain-containing protein 1-like [Athalia rosae]|uniref:cyclin N-terminal domain-containing protein 1-like n=1 Tax=Athalia rosae TaxID=37344 RepID=UPI002033FF08|nr:cyclin N-terminal domain-containing protein 1-like [Athalia rosae]
MSTQEITKIMELDTAYIEHLIQDWLQHVLEENAKQEQIFKEGTEFIIPYMAVPLPVIRTIFVISGHFGLAPNARYLTVHLFDKFMCNHFCELYAAKMGMDPTESCWPQICKAISSQAKLKLMSCMQLASKMDSHSKGLSISQVIQMLQWLDNECEFTRGMVFSAEFKVYKTVNFRIPLITPFHCVEILLAATKLSCIPAVHDICINLLDLAYLQHDRIYSHLQLMIRGNHEHTESDSGNVMALESDMLYLGAAVVQCSISFLPMKESVGKHLIQKLSDFVGIAETDIWKLANLLFTTALQNNH